MWAIGSCSSAPWSARPQLSSILLMSTLPLKRAATRIGTHNGTFHCDEALGCWLLKRTAKFRDAEIVRSRDPAVLDSLDIIIDVGGVYDPATCRFDHHQRGFAEVFGYGFNTKLSSAGLVYKHFGREIISDILKVPVDHADLEVVYLRVYKNFIEAVDAIDNGVNQYENQGPPKYLNSTSLSSRVGFLNPKWNEDSSDEVLYSQFLKAIELTGGEFAESVEYAWNCWLPGRAGVKEALERRFEADDSGQIMRLFHYCPWKDHLYDLEVEMALPKPILFCLYEDDREHKWRIQAVSVSPSSFENRKSLLAAWRGLRDEQLSEISGIPGCVFVHASGFIGGNITYEGVLEMAKRSLTAE